MQSQVMEAHLQVFMMIDSLIQTIVDEVKNSSGVKAIVLGGSRARGTNTSSSDIDLGIYYDPRHPLDLDRLGKVATNLDEERRADIITPIGGWGPWINGGGWLHIQSTPVDFLYRDLLKVSTVINSCINGKVEIFYQPGHPFGFVSSIYLGEVAICQPLWDPEGLIADLKSRVSPYPVGLQKAVIDSFSWEIDFSIGIARKSIERADVTYAAGCCFRSAMCMLQVLFGLNKEYWLNEKGAVAIADRFEIKPVDFQNRINEVFRVLDASPESINEAISLLNALSLDVKAFIQE
jgi:predicted nucleotidyltransferase